MGCTPWWWNVMNHDNVPTIEISGTIIRFPQQSQQVSRCWELASSSSCRWCSSDKPLRQPGAMNALAQWREGHHSMPRLFDARRAWNILKLQVHENIRKTTSEESHNWSASIRFHRIPCVAMQGRHPKAAVGCTVCGDLGHHLGGQESTLKMLRCNYISRNTSAGGFKNIVISAIHPFCTVEKTIFWNPRL